MKALIVLGIRYGVTVWAALVTLGALLLALMLSLGMLGRVINALTCERSSTSGNKENHADDDT